MCLIGPILLGAFLGVAVSRAIRWRRFHHHFHGGCGRMGAGPWGFRGFGRHGGFGGHGMGRQVFWLVRDLGLSTEQVSVLKDAWLKGRGAVASVRASGLEAVHAVLDTALAEPFDRSRLEDAARRHSDASGQAARDLALAIAAGVEVLTPEQRAKIRERFGRFGSDLGAGRGPFGPDGGPYRGGTYI